jgi:hypothetical protein
MADTETTATEETGMTRQPEARIGDKISGTCVTMGSQKTGRVTEVIGPVAFPDCGGYRYRLADTGEHYYGGAPVEPIVSYGRHEALATIHSYDSREDYARAYGYNSAEEYEAARAAYDADGTGHHQGLCSEQCPCKRRS